MNKHSLRWHCTGRRWKNISTDWYDVVLCHSSSYLTYAPFQLTIQKRIASAVDECRYLRDAASHEDGSAKAQNNPALLTLPMNAIGDAGLSFFKDTDSYAAFLAVNLAEEAASLCVQELVFKSSLMEAVAAPEPSGTYVMLHHCICSLTPFYP